jgi:hypothetical protein
MSASKQQRGNRRRTCHKQSVGLIDIPLVCTVAELQNLIKSLKSTPIMAQNTPSSHLLFLNPSGDKSSTTPARASGFFEISDIKEARVEVIAK